MSMTGIDGTTSSAYSGAGSLTAGNPTLGKNDFLKLLVSQLQNQDPLNPSDPTEFTAQLAQFSSLEQLSNVNKNLEKLVSSQDLGAMAFIGREVVAENTGFSLGAGNVDLGYRLNGPADEVTLHVQDSLGRTVARISAQGLTPGEHFLTWNGKDENGQAVPAGDYALMVSALQGEDTAVSATSLVKARVTGVDLYASGALLVTEAGHIPMNRVKMVRGG
jgi:flagellar basal-body rod modification protein FlgD